MGLAGFGLLQALWIVGAAGPQALASELLVAIASTNDALTSSTAILAANAKYLGFGLAYCALGGLIAWRARPHRGALMLGLVCAAIGANYVCAMEGTVFSYLGSGRREARLLFWIGAAGGMIRVGQLFPQYLSASRLTRVGSDAAGALRPYVDAVLRVMRVPLVAWGSVAVVYPLIFYTPIPSATWFAADTVVGLIGLLSLRRQYQGGTPDTRRRLTWVLSAGTFAVASMALSTAMHALAGAFGFPPEGPTLVITTGCTVGILGSLGMAVFYSGAIDPSLVVRRTVVYSGMGTVAMAGLGLLENLFAEYLESLFGGTTVLGDALLGCLIALGFRPLWKGFNALTEAYLPDAASMAGAEEEA